MIHFKAFKQKIQEQVQQTAVNDMAPLVGMPPAMLTLTRQSVRSYPTAPRGANIALYYAKQVNRYFTILYR